MTVAERLKSEATEPTPRDETLDLILTLVQLLTDKSHNAQARYKEFTRYQDAFSPMVRALIRYCVNYEFKPGIHSEEITVPHDPTEVYERLVEFERATTDAGKVVLLPPSNNFGDLTRSAHLLEGEVAYTLHPYNFWQVSVGSTSEPKLEVGNIHHMIRSAEEWDARPPSLRDMGYTPLVGNDTVEAYLKSGVVPDVDKSLVRNLLKYR